ncbi:terminase large subunit domain-containing protein [Endozoicomonas numazuensis]|uniref:Uncharacterized protein n=1 Tax=Endozoicomonas numazuensis TaxID=1137799 RepID=A0A081NL56_9GAMM|nr:terminase family protein [Endozoicomonas numazuensis]KEQ19179.1 hypothetical protein GZ78_04070 [Endozoicomonas numazuensis]
MSQEAPVLKAIGQPRLINLQEEKELYGVDVPDSADSVVPDKEPIFLGYQQKWFLDESQIKIFEKTRRCGATWPESASNVMTTGKPKRRGGRNVFYVGSRQEMALEYIAACALFAKAFDQLAQADVYEQSFWDEGKKEEILTYMIRFPNSGFKIQALSSRPSNLRGLQGDVVIDEAAFHEDLDELLKAAMALTMWGARVRIISTHNSEENLFNQYIKDARAGKKDYSVHRVTLDDALADGLYKRICFVTGQEWSEEAQEKWRNGLIKNAPTKEDAMEEYFCVPKRGGGAYIPRPTIEARTNRKLPVLRFTGDAEFNSRPEHERHQITDDWCNDYLKPLLDQLDHRLRHYVGQDFGRRVDLSVLIPLAVEANLKRKAPFILEMRTVPFTSQERIFYYLCNRLPRFSAGKLDARGNGEFLAEQARYKYGSIIEDVMASRAWYLTHMPKLKAAFEDDMIEIPADADTVDDIRTIIVDRGVPVIPEGRGKDSKDGKQRHGDAASALVLAYAATLEEGGLIEFTALPDKRSEPNEDHDEHFNEFEQGCW